MRVIGKIRLRETNYEQHGRTGLGVFLKITPSQTCLAHWCDLLNKHLPNVLFDSYNICKDLQNGTKISAETLLFIFRELIFQRK